MDAQKLEDKLTCAICLELYLEPVTLPCGHNFCGDCIRDWWGCRDKACPECREHFPDGAELRRNVALTGVLELMRAGPAPAPDPDPAPAPGSGPGARCPRHGQPLEFFCRTEGRCECSACTVNECRLHERALLDTERREREAQLRAMLEVTQQQATEAESQLKELQEQSSQIQSSACTLASVVSSKFSCLLQALEMRRTLALTDIEVAKTQALTRARDEERRLRGHLEALAHYDRRVRDLLEQSDDQTFLQESQLLAPPGPLGPLAPLQWDEEQQLAGVESLSRLYGLLLDEGSHPRAPAEAADLGPVEAPGPLAPVPSPVCPLRRKLWQNYRNLTFDPDSANCHLYLSQQGQQVKHRHKPRDLAGPRSFQLWQVQCAQSFRNGRHYWEVRTSNHSVTLGVAYPELSRHKQGPHTDNIGRGPSSWGLCVQEDRAQAWHNGEARRLPGVSGQLLGMDLDLASGRLTFYSLEPKAQPLHTFHAIFTQPLYPVFWLLEGRTLTLCHRPEAKLPPGLQEEAAGPS
ncbi:tripartite motif-containing protein 65 isoform X3 [Panthera pardus]|uniref:E3 ubiquitin-protein ligase TRIM65 n=2 Tax=Panthera TaxID=9688 RepID=A0A8C9D4F8_PANLE|nr:tripartite motif-containing protein 65 isoform X3 [Panthera pardus]XP_042772669.1 tripartite motif-containing protein 65 isoform X3 [Panthera leo]XP_060501329.1 E3 ubiquitin-protein ligase TRIM65 isoform X3 [Panthera onca]